MSRDWAEQHEQGLRQSSHDLVHGAEQHQVVDKAAMSRVMGKNNAAMPGHGPPYGENS